MFLVAQACALREAAQGLHSTAEGHLLQYVCGVLAKLSGTALLMDSLGADLLAAAYFLRPAPRGAWVIFGAALSHWIREKLGCVNMLRFGASVAVGAAL
jgi:hypothetical protein